MTTHHFAVSIVLANVFFAAPASAETFRLSSPDGRAGLVVEADGGRLRYAVEWKGTQLIRPSAVELSDASVSGVRTGPVTAVDSVWRPVWGQWSEIRDAHREMRLDLGFEGGGAATLICRAYNDGVAFRFDLSSALDRVKFRCEHRMDASARLWWPANEREPVGPVALADPDGRGAAPRVPVLADFGAAGVAAILESDLYSAPAFEAVQFGMSKEDDPSILISESTAEGVVGPTPWRVILVGDSPADLLMSTAALNLAAECRIPEVSWVRSGKALWDWRVHGYRAPDGFVYGVNTASYQRFIDFAARNNIQYFLIDDHWFTEASPGRLTVNEDLDIDEVMRYAERKGVGVLLYYDRRKGEFGDDQLYAEFARRGAKGLKYGFMGNDAAFTRAAIAEAAAHRLHLDFHDNPCPMTGVERTMPNLLTREYCHAQQDARRAFTPESFLKMAAINALAGPMDQNNGNFALNNINSGQRQRGPLKLNSYRSTVVSEAARVLVVHSGLMCLPDAPEEYEAKADLFEFIRRMPPATWDDTRVVDCGIGKSITTARRSGREWFVGSVIDSRGGELRIPLDFLDGDIAYEATIYEDGISSDGPMDPEAYRIRRTPHRRGDVVHARLAPGGGHCIRLVPAGAD